MIILIISWEIFNIGLLEKKRTVIRAIEKHFKYFNIQPIVRLTEFQSPDCLNIILEDRQLHPVLNFTHKKSNQIQDFKGLNKLIFIGSQLN